jgi:hypothetical protein
VTAAKTHFHRLDHPLTLAILSRLLDHRARPPAGYERTEQGALIDWEALAGSYLSSAEVAVVHIAHGCAIAERHGGLPPAAVQPVRQALEALTGPHLPFHQPRSARPARPASTTDQTWSDPTSPEVGL